MKRVFQFMVVAFVAAFAPYILALGGDEVGNDGDVVVCRGIDGEVNSIELLDYYEARNRFGFVPDLGSPQLSYEQKVLHVLRRISKIDPLRASRMQDEFDIFQNFTHFWPGVKLVDIPDSLHIAIPHGCEIEQVAIQAVPSVPEEKYFTVSKDLWDKMSDDDKAGLVLHEILFKELINVHKHVNSKLARYFNARISENRFSDLPTEDYLDLLSTLKADEDSEFSFGSVILKFGLYMSNRLAFYDNGQLQKVKINSPKDIRLLVKKRLDTVLRTNQNILFDVGGNFQGETYPILVEYFPSGQFKRAKSDSIWVRQPNGSSSWITGVSEVEFWDNGAIKSTFASMAQCHRTQQLRQRCFAEGARMQFNENGFVIEN
jgi:hypothetical protein